MPRKTTPENDLILSSAAAAPRRQPALNPRIKRNAKTAEVSDSLDVMAPPRLDPTQLDPTQEDIAALAFSYWEARGCQGGSPEEDWVRAEQQLRSRTSTSTA